MRSRLLRTSAIRSDLHLAHHRPFSSLREQIRVNGCGYFLFLLYPGAYVDLHQEQLQMISAVRQLR